MRDGRRNRRVQDRRWATWTLLAAVTLGGLLQAGCGGAGRAAQREGHRAAARELWDSAVLAYAKAVAENPTSDRYRTDLRRAKLAAAQAHFARAKSYLQHDQLELAVKELQETIVLDPTNQYALVELRKASAALDERRNAPSRIERARRDAVGIAAELGPPKLDPASNIPLVLKFPDASVGEVYETLSKTSGINFMFDEKVDLKKKVSIDLTNVSFEKAMDILMLMNKHFYKVIDGHTILVAEDTRPNHTTYDDQVIQTFYLSNAETQEVTQVLRALLEMRRIQENKNLNAITMKDTPEKIRVAERVIKANDKAKGEVIVDIELLELNRTKAQRLGLDLSSKALSLVFGDGKQSLALNDLNRVRQQSSWFLGPVPSVLLDFLRSDSDSRIIARPQLRILEGEKGNINIGQRVPLPATSFNTSQTIGGNVVPITSFNYQQVGIQVEVKPRVHHNKEVTLDLKAEVSALAGNVEGSGGFSQPIIGNRQIETTIRLQDGETNLMAGLIKEEERTSLSGLPGIAEIPVLRSLFGATRNEADSSDIVLSVTPHIVRVPDIEAIDMAPLWVGTEERVQLRGVARNALGESPFAGPSPWDEIDRQLGVGAEPAPAAGAQGKVEAKGEPSPESPAAGARTRAQRAKQPAAAAGPPPQPAAPSPGAAAGGGAPSPSAAPVEETAPTPARTVAQIQLAPAQSQVAAGDAVVVDIVIGDAVGVGAVNFQLRYDPFVLRFVPPAVLGDFLQQGGVPVDLQAVEGAEGGLIVVSAARLGGTGAVGAGALVRLSFVALEAGDAGFSFPAAQVRAPDGAALPASFRVGAVEVTP